MPFRFDSLIKMIFLGTSGFVGEVFFHYISDLGAAVFVCLTVVFKVFLCLDSASIY